MLNRFVTKGFSFLKQIPLLSEAEKEESLISEIWHYIIDKYYTVNFNEYEYQHITVSSSGIVSARNVIIAICIGVIIASAISLFQKRTLGDLVRALCREDCTSPEQAKTLAELGLVRNTAIKADLRHGTSLNRVVRCVEKEAFLASQKQKYEELSTKNDKKALRAWKELPYRHDFETDHFYIPKDLSYGADIQFDRRGTTPIAFVFTVIACLVFAAFACFLLPELLQFADNFLGIFSSQ